MKLAVSDAKETIKHEETSLSFRLNHPEPSLVLAFVFRLLMRVAKG